MSNDNSNFTNAGGLWVKTSRKGTQYLSGHIELANGERVYFNVFENKFSRDGNNRPQYTISRIDTPPEYVSSGEGGTDEHPF